MSAVPVASFEPAVPVGQDVEQALRDELDNLTVELAERYEELHLVYSMDARIREFSGGWDAFQGLLELCAQHLNVDLAAIVYPAENLTLSADNLSKPMFNQDLVLVEMRGDLYRFVQSARQSVVINEPADPRRGYIFTDMPYKVLACPLLRDHAVCAMLVLVNHDDKKDFEASDRKLAEVMANQLTNSMQMFRAFEEARRFTQEVVGALIETVEAKDPYTRGHSERVQSIAVDVARELGLEGDALESVSWAALLHDVGKVGVPDAVLCKPAALTDDEYTFIKMHAERGCEILSHIKRLHHVIPAVRHHHERFDGHGYPAGIAGSAIPLASRVIAVADTYDAMTSSRAYRPGKPHEAAVAEVRRVAGTQLDPEVVVAFLRVCERDPDWLLLPGTGRSRNRA